MSERLIKNLKIIKADKSLTNNDLSELMGVSLSVIKNYLRGKTVIPPEKLETLSSKLQIDAYTLRPANIHQVNDIASTYRKAKAGHSVASNHRVHIRGLLASVVDDLPEAVYDVFEVEGSSMETTLSQGDKLLCRLDNIDSMQDSRVYVLVITDPKLRDYRESGVWIKRCSNRVKNGYVSCRSDNKDTTEPYPTFRVKAGHIKEVWYPVLKITAHLSDPNRDIYDQLDELRSRIEMLEASIDL